MSDKPYLLVVEDDEGLREQLKWAFSNYEVITAQDKNEAISKLRRYEPGVVTLDLGLPPDPTGYEEGLNILQEIVSLSPSTKVIMVTGQSDRIVAMQAINSGAYDFYVKPIDPQALNLIIDRAYYLHTLEKEYNQLNTLTLSHSIKGILTSSPIMQKVCRTVQKVASTNISVLLLGESGTGKEVLANALHEHSERSHEPFIAINCAAIPEALLESELFGYEKGAFTGAVKQTRGKIEMAHKGTLFLDEIGDLPLSLQPKLLRFLQERTFERLGGRSPISVDVRVVCATHHDLQESIQAHTFREDLYYRLSEVTISIPPLRDRMGDAAVMARLFLSRFSQEYKRPVKRFSAEALEAIHRYSWPGNVRELENKIKRSVVMAENTHITLADLELPFNNLQSMPFNLKQIRDLAEKEAITTALNYCDSNMSKAAELLGITRPTLYNLMEKLAMTERELSEKESL
ncbi:PEP-CTERM-box response regulator transcription factor [Candidatus Berkiella aquae]|uniref:PEP-CTERM-box response regulator transcription factor n=1 Tax=Candidatus Berkiella aquae TaxID=295108 RepID=A0A0Q9YPE1_9GAMM|nr:PEP-CTERM-box response regulator transcription factor [Candidatus Berkiella aquae]MCS5712059.1 PEP-CTERM-box response regulator transcription factor [Candidatus Berkiella aquae]